MSQEAGREGVHAAQLDFDSPGVLDGILWCARRRTRRYQHANLGASPEVEPHARNN
jgi:hypothetical protein